MLMLMSMLMLMLTLLMTMTMMMMVMMMRRRRRRLSFFEEAPLELNERKKDCFVVFLVSNRAAVYVWVSRCLCTW